MLRLPTLVCVALTTFTSLPCRDLRAQQTLTTSYSGNTFLSSNDGGVYFDLVVLHGLQLDRLDLNLLAPVGAPVVVDVHVRPGSWRGHVGERGDWVHVARSHGVAAGAGLPTVCALPTPIGLPGGTVGVALHVQGAMPIYGFAFGPRSFANGDLVLTAGGATTQFLTGTPFESRVWNGTLHYTPGGGPHSMALVQPYGSGCGGSARSSYEWFGPGDLDLAHSELEFVPNPSGGFDVRHVAAAGVALPVGATDLGLVRGGAALVPLAAPFPGPGGALGSVLVCADGRIVLTERGLLGPALAAPSPSALFADAPVLAPAWLDLAPTTGRNVHVARDAAAGTTTFVWWDVPAYGDPAAVGNTFACTLAADGRVTFRFAAVANPVGGALVGIGSGQGGIDPGPRDLGSWVPFATGADRRATTLTTVGRPVLGTTTSFVLRDLPPAAGMAALVVGLVPDAAGQDLGNLGAPGCRLHVARADSVFVPFVAGAGIQLAVPPLPSLLGLALHAQAAVADAAANALGVVVTPALALTVGSV